MNNIADFKKFDLTDTEIDLIDCYAFDEENSILALKGNLKKSEPEFHNYDIWFQKIKTATLPEIINTKGKLKKFSLSGEEGTGFSVQLEIDYENDVQQLDFLCKTCHVRFMRYRGVDYTNVYGTEKYNQYLKEYFLHLEDEEFFVDEQTTEISDELTHICKEYMKENDNCRTFMTRNFLYKNGEVIHNYITVGGHHKVYKKIINHSNGHRYYPFNVDLYGISYIDIDTYDVYNYIPKGHDNDRDAVCGESFIVTDAFYDPATNLIAYEGCYWAGTFDVMVGNFSNPLNFNPYLISIHKILDPEYEEFDDVDFDKWGETMLTVKTDGMIKEVPLSDIADKIKMRTI